MELVNTSAKRKQGNLTGVTTLQKSVEGTSHSPKAKSAHATPGLSCSLDS